MFTTTKRELSELYAFVRLLADGRLVMGDEAGAPRGRAREVISIERVEHDGPRQYLLEGEEVAIVQPEGRRTVSRALLEALANALLQTLREGEGQEVAVDDEIEEILDMLQIYDLEARTTDRTDLQLTLDAAALPPVGVRIFSRLGSMIPLLDGGRAANLKLEQGGIKFAVPTVNKINALPAAPDEVARRMEMIERLGGTLRFADVADRVFRANLGMIDLHFARLLAEMVRLMHLEDITRITTLTERMEVLNPLKIKEELITKHGYYRYKVGLFLLEAALGMRPAKIFDGSRGAIGGLLLVGSDGTLSGYDESQRDLFIRFLYRNSRLLKGDVEKDKYGFLERENGKYYFKLNVKVGLLKR